MREAENDAHRAVRELVDVADAEAIPRGFGIGCGAYRVVLEAPADGDHAAAEVQRTDGLHVHGARQALTDKPGIRRLEDRHSAQQLGRVLVELDAAIVPGADQLAAVEQGGGEVGRQAPDADHLGAASDPLRRQAGQACDGFSDAVVGQLAGVFRGDRFDDGIRVLLGLDRALDAQPNSGDGDGFGGLLGLCESACGQEGRCCGGDRSGLEQAARGALRRNQSLHGWCLLKLGVQHDWPACDSNDA